jgi:hypothetical protein
VAAAAGQPVADSIPIPDLGLAALPHPPLPLAGPGMRVTCEFLLAPEEWEHHWSMAARQIKDPVENKGRKTYKLPSIVVLDVSRWAMRDKCQPGRGPPSSRTCCVAEPHAGRARIPAVLDADGCIALGCS